jgi:rRNA-processing protein FCF1
MGNLSIVYLSSASVVMQRNENMLINENSIDISMQTCSEVSKKVSKNKFTKYNGIITNPVIKSLTMRSRSSANLLFRK